ncbi:sigma-70 family RNA polymerase sigma factor [Latilactobacillus sakei]|uniref:sigma-70 family RNA polymerase sigma factor n=1 Tax=Latilactobacillus sakei TaxID=1599 RepID=UPI000C6F15C5|nr:sigma-70 family RNA polymerase sigma factor [Latilactobacillus sakei]SON68642.1 conserved protein of unknown function [Latilactobacillus sakei]
MTKSNQAAFNRLLQDDNFIYGALKSLHINRYHEDFDDLYQEAILTFIDAYQRFPGDPETHEHEFIVYAYQAIKWATMRHFRQENGRNKQIGFVNRLSEDDALMDYLDQISDPHCNPDNAVIYNDLFEKLYQVCDPRERRFLVLRYFANASLKEIAADLNITRRTANNIKFRVQKKFSKLLIL